MHEGLIVFMNMGILQEYEIENVHYKEQLRKDPICLLLT